MSPAQISAASRSGLDICFAFWVKEFGFKCLGTSSAAAGLPSAWSPEYEFRELKNAAGARSSDVLQPAIATMHATPSFGFYGLTLQRFQNPLTKDLKEYTLMNYSRIPDMISGPFLNLRDIGVSGPFFWFHGSSTYSHATTAHLPSGPSAPAVFRRRWRLETDPHASEGAPLRGTSKVTYECRGLELPILFWGSL